MKQGGEVRSSSCQAFIITAEHILVSVQRERGPGRGHCLKPHGDERPKGCPLSPLSSVREVLVGFLQFSSRRPIRFGCWKTHVRRPSALKVFGASILWKDGSRAMEAAELMKITS